MPAPAADRNIRNPKQKFAPIMGTSTIMGTSMNMSTIADVDAAMPAKAVPVDWITTSASTAAPMRDADVATITNMSIATKGMNITITTMMPNAAVDMNIITITAIPAVADMITTIMTIMNTKLTNIMQPDRKSRFSFWRIWDAPTVLLRWNAALMN